MFSLSPFTEGAVRRTGEGNNIIRKYENSTYRRGHEDARLGEDGL